MATKQRGTILVIILLFLFIFSLLAISGLTSSRLQLRMSNNFAQRNQIIQTVNAGLIKAEQSLLRGANNKCLANAQLLQPWLVGNSCTLRYNTQLVHYIIEPLLENECLVIGTGVNKQALLAMGNIYRITAWLELSQKPALILQTTYATVSKESCKNPVNEIKPGRLSWREIDN